MKKSALLQLLADYDRAGRWKLREKEDQRIELLRIFLLLNPYYERPDHEEIFFGEFVEYLQETFPQEDLAQLFTQSYLTGNQRSAPLFRQFVEDASESRFIPADKMKSNKNTFKIFSPKITAKPDKIRPFSQGEFKQHYAPHMKGGLCNALTITWYELLNMGHDLIVEANKTPLDPVFLKKIIAFQQRGHDAEYTRFLAPDFRHPSEVARQLKKYREQKKPSAAKTSLAKELHAPDDTKQSAPEAYLSSLDFDEAQTQSIRYGDFEHYLNTLKKQNHSEQGLHLICASSLLHPSAHIIGWTYKDGNYILFDANAGEFYFKEFEKFRAFLLDYVNFSKLYKAQGLTSLYVCDLYRETPQKPQPK